MVFPSQLSAADRPLLSQPLFDFRLCLVQAIPLWQKAGAGLTAGGLGAMVGSPADLSLIRMQVRKSTTLERPTTR